MRPEIKFSSEARMLFFNENVIRAFLYSDYSIDTHNHDFYEMNIVMNGSGVHQIENACIEVRAGDVFVIPPSTIHGYFHTNKLDVYHVLFHKSFIDKNRNEAIKMPGFIQFMEIEPFLRQRNTDSMFLHLSRGRLMELESELKFIEDNSEYDSEALSSLKSHTAWKIIYWLSFLLSEQLNENDKSRHNKNEQAIIKSLEFIHTHYGEKITIELLCRQAYLSRSTFLRSFKDICGCTPLQYLTGYRREKACEMINGGSLSKTEAAHKCGFYDLSHMERILKL